MPDRSLPPGFSPPQIDLRQFYQLFFEETQENLDQLERMLLSTHWDHATDEDFHALFRCAHSIKGSAATFGFDTIAQLAHHTESLLDLWRKQLAAPNDLAINHMLAAADLMRSMVQAHTQEQAIAPALLAQVVPVTAALESHLASPTASAALGKVAGLQTDSAASLWPVAESPTAAAIDVVTATAADDDFGFFTDAPGAPPATLEADLALNAQAADAIFWDESTAAEHTAAVQQQQPAETRSGDLTSSPVATADTTLHSVRVPVARVDDMVNLLGELVVSQTALQQSLLRLAKSQRDALQLQLDVQQDLIRKMRDTVMHIRMVPVSQLFKRFPRLIHDLSQRLGKQVQLFTEGDSTELDKGIIERITDPLMHVLRNCMDHGFETPQERLRNHKKAQGTLWIRAHTQGSYVALQVQDDGRGLSRHKLLSIAASKGIDVPPNASDAQVWQLAFVPGVSTSEALSDVSGRGVGMDVVKRNIESLGGRVEIESVAQQGTTITLWLPLTLAITDGLVVQSGNEQYIVPLAAVLESMPAKPMRIETLGKHASVVQLNDTYYPVVALDQLMRISRAADTTPHEAINATLLLLHAGSHRVGLLVDQLIGQQQVVVKSVETHYRKIPYISAATVLGDGQVALILDVSQLATTGQVQGWVQANTLSTASPSRALNQSPPSTDRPSALSMPAQGV